MVEIIGVQGWSNIRNFRGPTFYIRLQSEDDLHKIAKTLDIEFIFKKDNELLCIHGITTYWYKP